jgi:hypothetical protein
MNLFSFISSIFAPAAKLVDELHTSDEERLTLANKLAVIQNEMHSKILDYESKLLAAQSGIITAEANGQSWMQRNWRPITMLTFLALVVFDSFGWLANPLASEAWTLLQIGLGGYVTGRSLEKIADKVKK